MVEELTKREKEVYYLAVNTPWSISQIASALKIKNASVQTHLVNIFLKFGVNSRKELMINYYTNIIENCKKGVRQ